MPPAVSSTSVCPPLPLFASDRPTTLIGAERKKLERELPVRIDSRRPGEVFALEMVTLAFDAGWPPTSSSVTRSEPNGASVIVRSTIRFSNEIRPAAVPVNPPSGSLALRVKSPDGIPSNRKLPSGRVLACKLGANHAAARDRDRRTGDDRSCRRPAARVRSRRRAAVAGS